MIESLHVRTYVLIDELDLSFNPSFIVLTGETGSGKSIILGALSLLLGAKADKSDVREGKKEAEISGTFFTKSKAVEKWCEEHSISFEDNTLVIRRVIKAEGRSIYSVNSSPITRQEGEELGNLLVDFSSQHSHQSLMKKENFRLLLDDYAQNSELCNSYSKSYDELRNKEKEIEDVRKLLLDSKEEEDYLKYCLNEIEKGELKVGEEEELKEKLKKISNSEFILEEITSSLTDMKEGLSLLGLSLSSLNKALRKDESLNSLSERLDSSTIEVEDIYSTLREYSSSINLSEGEIEEMNSRLSTIQRLKRRYGGSVEKALSLAEEYKKKIDILSNSEENISQLEKEEKKLRDACLKKADELSKRRKDAAKEFSKKIETTLRKLGMENAEFIIKVSEGDLNKFGKDEVEFLISANKGEKAKSVENTASGGELSRIMLSIKAQAKFESSVDTLVFDEIDSGLGGVTAHYVAEELSALSKNDQVIAITHLAQIASKADEHYVVSKSVENNRTVTKIKEVEGDDRVNEIARLLSGDNSSISIEHAKKLLSNE